MVDFEIEADDPERASRFYETVFGWGVKKYEGEGDFWELTTGPDDQPGINGEIMRRMDPPGGVHFNIDAPSVAEFENRVKQMGGRVVVPCFPISGVGYLAYCRDTEGNLFGILQSDPSVEQ